MVNRLTVVGLLCGVCVMCAAAAPIDVPRVDAPPTIDGALSDGCWAEATVLGDFGVMGSEDQAADTEARMCHDGVWLYVGVRCGEAEPDAIVAKRMVRDGSVNLDDSVEVFVSPHAGGAIYYHFLLSVTNTRAEQVGRPTGTPTRSWDPGWRSATTVGDDGWYAEMALPLAVIGGGSGDQWLLNVCRNKRTEPAQYISLAPVQRGFRELEHFLAVTPIKIEGAPYAPCIRDARVTEYITEGEQWGYEVVLQTGNVTGEAGELALTITDTPMLGEASSVSAALKLGPVEERDQAVFVPVASPGLREVTVVMNDPVSGEQRQWLQVADTSPLSPLSVYLDRSYYTTEASAQAVCELQMPSGRLAGWRLVALDADGETIAERKRVTGGESAFGIDLKKMANGSHEITVQLRDRTGTLIAESRVELVKLPPAAHEAKIDRVNQVLLRDGEPHFPIGFLTVPAEDVAEHAAHGMTSCSSFALPWRPDEMDANDTLAAATEHGLTCVEYLPRLLRDAEGRRVRKMEPDFVERMGWVVENTLPGIVEHARDQESLIGYYSVDEPFGDTIFTGCEALYNGVREHDPYHPVYVLFSSWIGGDQDWTQVMDIPGVDPYMRMGHPTADEQRYTLQHMAASTSLARKQADEMQTTLWIVPQSEFYSGSVRPLLPDEQRCQTWMGLIYGGRGLLWFRNPVYHSASWENFGTLVADVKKLEAALVNRLPAQEVSVEPERAVRWDFPILHACVLTEPGGDAIVMAANSEPRPMDVSFALEGLPKNARVTRMFGEGQVAVADGAFADALGRYGTQAYRISGWRLPDDGPARLRVTVSGEALDELVAPRADHPMPPGERNLIGDGDFEALDAWDVVPGGGAGREPAEITFPDSPETGGKALRIERDNDYGNACVIAKEWFQPKPNTRYRYGAQIKGELTRGTGRFSMMLVDESGHGIGWPSVTLRASSTGWVSMVQETATGDAPPKFRVWASQYRVGGVAWFDNVFLEEIGPVKRVGNLMHNSSFEKSVLDGWPDLWWPDASIKPRIGAPDGAWGSTDEDAWHGERCMRITRPGSVNGRVYSTQNYANESVPGQTYTLSVYARADQAGRTMMLVLGGHGKRFELTEEWARYSMTEEFRGANWRGDPEAIWADIRCEDEEGTYWLDAVQIEPGEEATEYIEDEWPGATR